MSKAPEDRSFEGWYQDPYGGHEARWYSEGVPTSLVRDGEDVSHDPPPPGWHVNPIAPAELELNVPEGPGDLRRADAYEANYSSGAPDMARAGEEPNESPGDAAFDVEFMTGQLD